MITTAIFLLVFLQESMSLGNQRMLPESSGYAKLGKQQNQTHCLELRLIIQTEQANQALCHGINSQRTKGLIKCLRRQDQVAFKMAVPLNTNLPAHQHCPETSDLVTQDQCLIQASLSQCKTKTGTWWPQYPASKLKKTICHSGQKVTVISLTMKT